MTRNLTRRGAVWYARIAVPSDLVNALNKAEVWRSLKTKDKKEAERRRNVTIEAIHQEWDIERKKRTLDENDIQHAIWDRYNQLLDADSTFRTSLPDEDELSAVWRQLAEEFGEDDISAFRIFEIVQNMFDDNRAERIERQKLLKFEASRGKIGAVADSVNDFLRANNLKTANPKDHKQLALMLTRSELEALKRQAERDEGDFSGQPGDSSVRAPAIAKTAVVPVGETIMDLFDKYHRERPASLAADTWDQNRKIVNWFSDFVGPKKHVSVVTRKLARDWKAKLFEWPVKATEVKAFAGMSFLEIIDANKAIKKPCISDKTINKYLAGLGSFCNYLFKNDYIEVEIMRGLYLELDRNEQKVFPFTSDQLSAIFASPLFTGCLDDDQEHKPGMLLIDDWRYWLPLIALFSGARLGEISQLLVTDVRQIHGQWCFHICRDGAGIKRVKTDGSERVVPIHSELISFGLLEYLKKVEAGKHIRLFPEIVSDARGSLSGMPSGFYQGYLKAVGVKVDRTVNFHSFRHNVTDAFRKGGYLDETFGILLGHVRATTTQRYGIVEQGDLELRTKIIQSIRFPETSHVQRKRHA